jgi:ABC-2 type transport system permease protein
MTTEPLPATTQFVDATNSQRRNLAQIYWLQFKYEFLKQLRIPFTWVGTIIFPLAFYSIFGLIFSYGGEGSELDPMVSASYLANYGAFGVMGVALFSFGVGVATERGQGWLRLSRATPMPPTAYFTAKIGASMVFGAFSLLSLFLGGLLVGGIHMPITLWLGLFLMLLIGCLPFCALGLVLGYAAGPNSAPILANLIYLPVAIVSGLWVPIEFLPAFLQRIALFLPAYHYAQLAQFPLGTGHGRPIWFHLGALVTFTVICLALAVFLYRRDEGKSYG